MSNEKKRVCIVCGHEACPYCKDWCDVVLYDEEGEPSLCCGGECTYKNAVEPEILKYVWCTFVWIHYQEVDREIAEYWWDFRHENCCEVTV